jgi:hypothetical protein
MNAILVIFVGVRHKQTGAEHTVPVGSFVWQEQEVVVISDFRYPDVIVSAYGLQKIIANMLNSSFRC